MNFDSTISQAKVALQRETEESMIAALGIVYCLNRGLSCGPNILMHFVEGPDTRQFEQNYLGQYEADFLYITKNNYLYEIEVKISIEDFRADQKKKHYHDHPDVRGFYYCIPSQMFVKQSEEILQVCKSRGAGLIVKTESTGLTVYQKAKQRKEVPPLKTWQRIYYLKLFANKWVTRYQEEKQC